MRHSVVHSDILWSSSSSDSDSPGIQAQVKKAMGMLDTKFSKHQGNGNKKDDRVYRYHPFMYLNKERQREIVEWSWSVQTCLERAPRLWSLKPLFLGFFSSVLLMFKCYLSIMDSTSHTGSIDWECDYYLIDFIWDLPTGVICTT